MCFYWCFRGYQLELYSIDIGRELPFVVATSCWNFIIIQFPICMQIKHFSDIQCLISNQFQDIWTETRMILFTTLCFWQIISGKIRKPLISVSCFVLFFSFFFTGHSFLTSCLGSSPITLQVNVAGGESRLPATAGALYRVGRDGLLPCLPSWLLYTRSSLSSVYTSQQAASLHPSLVIMWLLGQGHCRSC